MMPRTRSWPRSAARVKEIFDETALHSYPVRRPCAGGDIVKLQNAQNALARGDAHTACNLLDTFIREVNAQVGKTLTADQANQLIAGAEQVKTVLDC